MEYKYEIHCHTKDVSKCGQVPAEDVVNFYKEKGYSGIVITDHYSPMTFTLKEHIFKKKATDKYLTGYKKAKALESEDFTVLLGVELRFYGTINDYLIYGVKEEDLYNGPYLLTLCLRRAYKYFHSEGCIVIQAHPFRKFMHRKNPKYLDGAEVNNGKDTKENKEKANEWADTFPRKPIKVGGSDFHRLNQANKLCGIITEEKIKTNDDLLRILKSGEFKLIGIEE